VFEAQASSVNAFSPRWISGKGGVDYESALAFMEKTVQGVKLNQSPETIWCLEHPPLFTAGTSAKESHLLDSLGLPVYKIGRGGQHTYHGPGQLVVYVMIDLEKRKKDIRTFVQTLEGWIIKGLAPFGIAAEQKPGRIGLWVQTDEGEQKIASIGVRVTKWVTWHGFSINVSPNLDHFKGIVPCGLSEFGVTSFEKLGIKASLLEVEEALKDCCPF